MTTFLDALGTTDHLLAEGSMFDRLKRRAGECFDPDLAYLGLLYSEKGRAALRESIAAYIRSAAQSGHSIVLFSPTWRANVERVARSSHCGKDVNRDAVEFVRKIVSEELSQEASRAFIGGLMGCRNDCYSPRVAMAASDSERFHQPQVDLLASSGVDLLFASTLPAVCEAIGIAHAMARTSLPYAMSFVLDGTGAVLDGTPFVDAIRLIDQSVSRAPVGYCVNCVHPATLLAGLSRIECSDTLKERFIGIQGNTSTKDPRAFDSLSVLETETPATFAEAAVDLAERFKLKIIGGCCGTGPEHIAAIGERLRRRPASSGKIK